MTQTLPPFIYVDTPQLFNDTIATLKEAKRIAVDIESNSMYVYREEVCLIQVSTEQQDYIIDPLLDLDLEPLGALLADPSIEKIFHAAEYDLILLKRHKHWSINNLFDTMWAGRVLSYQKIGLANMLGDLFDVTLDKKYQRADWGKRPLTPDQLTYAQSDTHYLFRLRDQLEEELIERGRLEEAQESFRQQEEVNLPNDTFDPDRFWSLKGVLDLNKMQRAVGYAVYRFRDDIGARTNRPTFKIFGNKTVLEIAEQVPNTIHHLHQIKGIGSWLIHRYGQEMLAIIRDAKNPPYPKRPRYAPRPPQDVLDRYDALQRWRRDKGREREVESDVIVNKDVLFKIAQSHPLTAEGLAEYAAEIGPWRHQQYGAELLDLLKTLPRSEEPPPPSS